MTNPHQFSNWKSSHRSLLAPIATGTALRLALMLAAFTITGTEVMIQGDTASYLEPGRNLFLHGAYRSQDVPELDRTPGYPIFLMLTGMYSGNVLLTITAQILVAAVSVWLVYRIADRVFPSSQAGVIAAWLFALEPVSLSYSARLMPETLFVLLLLIAIDRLLAFQAALRLSTLSSAGVALAAATYVRPVSYYLVFALCAGLAVTTPSRNGLKWKAPAVLLLSVIPLLGLWQLRNASETGYSGFSSIVDQNLYFFQSAELTAEQHNISLDAEQAKLGYPDEVSYIAVHPEQRLWSQSQRLHYMREQAMQVLSDNRWVYLKTHFIGVGVVALTPCATNFLQLIGLYPADNQMPRHIVNEGVIASVQHSAFRHPFVTIAKALFEIYLLAVYLATVVGIFSRYGWKTAKFTLVGIALYILLISGGAQAVGRYRIPMMPELCVLAAGGWIANRKSNGRSPIGLRPSRSTIALETEHNL